MRQTDAKQIQVGWEWGETSVWAGWKDVDGSELWGLHSVGLLFVL